MCLRTDQTRNTWSRILFWWCFIFWPFSWRILMLLLFSGGQSCRKIRIWLDLLRQWRSRVWWPFLLVLTGISWVSIMFVCQSFYPYEEMLIFVFPLNPFWSILSHYLRCIFYWAGSSSFLCLSCNLRKTGPIACFSGDLTFSGGLCQVQQLIQSIWLLLYWKNLL